MARYRASTAQRGYGNDHRRLRAQWARRVAQGGVLCVRCGLPIPLEWLPCPKCHKPTQKGGYARKGYCGWDLDHHDHDRSAYLGPSHACCNRATAGRRPVKHVTRDW